MATYSQLAITIVDAALNKPATQTQRNRILAAYGADLAAGATTAQITEYFVTQVHSAIVTKVLDYEARVAASAAADTKRTEIRTDLAQAPQV